MPPLSDKELERRLHEAGKSLLRPPSSVDELLPILDRTMELLSKVEQSPTKAMVDVLSPLMEELVAEALLKHSDLDVKVGVASCISEITRITAPEAPYGDDTMKEVFQLIVSSFENISDTSSRSHEKRAAILETVAKIRSCVIMLDLECDEMIIEMFQHFLKEIRNDLAESIFASMEAIMTLVIEESEDISLDLLNPILSTLKKDNKDVLLIAKKLAEGVVQNCAEKLGPHLTQALTTLNASLDDYSNVVASVCCVENGTGKHSDENICKGQLAVERKTTSASPVRGPVTQVAEDDGTGETHPHDEELPVRRSPESTVNNPVNGSGTEETMADAIVSETVSDSIVKETVIEEAATTDAVASETPIGEDATTAVNHLKEVDNNLSDVSKSEFDEGAKKSAESEADVEHTTNNDSVDSSNLLDDDKRTEPAPESPSEEDAHSSPRDDVLPVEEAPKDDDLIISTPKLSGSLPKKNQSKKSGRRTKRKGNLFRKETTSADTSSKKASEQKPNSEAKKKQHTVKKQPVETANEDRASSDEDASRNDGGNTSDTESRSLDQTEKPDDASNKMDDGSQSRNEESKKSGRGKKSSGRDLGKDKVTSPRSPLSKSTKHEDAKEESSRMSMKRKRTPGTDKASGSTKSGENLVGSKVKVWWPKDKMFYEGVVASYDSVKKKHQVIYADGDTENLNLQKEKWEFVEDDQVPDEVPAGEDSSSDDSSDPQRTKKGNASSEAPSKRAKLESSPKGKSKGIATKSAGKSKDDKKPESKSKDKNSKSSGKSEDSTIKSKDRSQKVGAKSQEDSAKPSGKSKDDVAKTPSQSKQESSQKTAKGNKGKTPQSVKSTTTNSTTNGIGMKKSGSSKVAKEKTSDLIKLSEMAKGKSPDKGKSRESEKKSGKKRRR